MARPRRGSVWYDQQGNPYARVTFTDEDGKRRDYKRKAQNVTHAWEIVEEMVAESRRSGTQGLDAQRMTFAELAVYYETNYLIPPVYRDGRKVAGARTYLMMRRLVALFTEHFGHKRLRDIRHGDLRRYRARRLQTKTWRGDDRSIGAMNRELQVLRRMFSIAEQQGWIAKSPFKMGDPLISVADEKQRERILSRDEEKRLLAACEPSELTYERGGREIKARHTRRTHLRAIIICALDTAMRQGEILSLKWSNVSLKHREISIAAFNTKTMRARVAPITKRLARELESLRERAVKRHGGEVPPETLVFGFTDNVKHAFQTARAEAELPDLRFHDLRHTAITRMIEGGMPIEQVMRISGHTTLASAFRYINAHQGTVHLAAAVLDRFNEDD